jgi:hypothetical protein
MVAKGQARPTFISRQLTPLNAIKPLLVLLKPPAQYALLLPHNMLPLLPSKATL